MSTERKPSKKEIYQGIFGIFLIMVFTTIIVLSTVYWKEFYNNNFVNGFITGLFSFVFLIKGMISDSISMFGSRRELANWVFGFMLGNFLAWVLLGWFIRVILSGIISRFKNN